MTRLPSLGARGQGWVLLQVLLLASVALAGLAAGGAWAGTPAAATALLGLALMVGGAALLARGLIDLGPNLTPLPYPRDDSRLVESGAYALVRHPLYGGLILASVGWGLVTASPVALLLAGVLAIFFELKSRREEMWLLERFPSYLDYRRRTRRFIPWLY